MRRVEVVDAMLFGAMLLWALNITVTKYMFIHGWKPLAYGTMRYGAAIAIFWIFVFWRERSFRIEREDWGYVAVAALMIFLNQLCFVYALDFARASTISLLFAITPVFMGLFALLLGREHLHRAFWIGAVLSIVGVGLVAAASGEGFSSGLKGDLLGLGLGITWASYSLAIAPLMRRYSPFRISAVVLLIGWIPLCLVSVSQLHAQEFSFGWKVWLGFAYAVVGPLFLTNLLWFNAIDRVGASRASLFQNMQPFFAVFFAIILLSESLHGLEIAGGVLIFAGIALERIAHREAVAIAPPE
jgi:drug/metabolite transporter (DMT)-like permease